MQGWKSIEAVTLDNPIWVIKYTLYHRLVNGRYEWCNKGDDGWEAMTDCHGYYTSEEDARAVLNHFPKPNTYRVEKVYQRRLKC